MAGPNDATRGTPLERVILLGDRLTFQDMRGISRSELERLGLPVSQAGQRLATFSGPAVVGGSSQPSSLPAFSDYLRSVQMASPMGPPAQARVPDRVTVASSAPQDAASARAARINAAVSGVLGRIADTPGRVADRFTEVGARTLGIGASALGATGFGANQLRTADALRDQREAAAAPAPAAAGAAGAKTPPAPVQVSQEVQDQLAVMRMLRSMEGMSPVRMQALRESMLPPRAATLAPRDQIMADLRAIALADYQRVAGDPNATQEQYDAAANNRTAALIAALGVDPFRAMLAQQTP